MCVHIHMYTQVHIHTHSIVEKFCGVQFLQMIDLYHVVGLLTCTLMVHTLLMMYTCIFICTHTHTYATVDDDWNIVSVECGSLAAKWEQLSACLGLAKADIDRIRENRPRDSAGCWSEALSQWIKQNYSTQRFGLPSWRSLLSAVAMVDRRLCKELANKHTLGMTWLEWCKLIPTHK